MALSVCSAGGISPPRLSSLLVGGQKILGLSSCFLLSGGISDTGLLCFSSVVGPKPVCFLVLPFRVLFWLPFLLFPGFIVLLDREEEGEIGL